MIYLILCILSSTGIFVLFKVLDQQKLPPFPAILINYLVAAILGFLITDISFSLNTILAFSWFPVSILIGFLFIVMFFVIAFSSGEVGISITTVASKMSVVFPIAFSMLIDPSDQLTFIKLLAILGALTGVVLTIYTPGEQLRNSRKLLLPIVLFVGMGVVDSMVKYAQHAHVEKEDTALFSGVLFMMAFITGLFFIPIRRKSLYAFKIPKMWGLGILLGIVNFGSIYFMVSALNHVNSRGEGIDSSVIFGSNNIGIVSLSVLAGLLLFREKLSRVNWLGLLFCATSILLFSLA